VSATLSASKVESNASHLTVLASQHPCWSHPFFDALVERRLSVKQVAGLLRNYDAHASVLRRLLLKAAGIMPEPAVGYVLENVRNEYGNGDYSLNHQAQLRDVARQAGVSFDQFDSVRIEDGVREFCKRAVGFYTPSPQSVPHGYLKSAVSAGAITATELLAIKEFQCLQIAFAKLDLAHHIWFQHVAIEEAHSGESLDLALHFVDHNDALASIEFGMLGILNANIRLYDGLLAAIR
jgi:Iron-containing redox enzyme